MIEQVRERFPLPVTTFAIEPEGHVSPGPKPIGPRSPVTPRGALSGARGQRLICACDYLKMLTARAATSSTVTLRDRTLRTGALVLISPWTLTR